MKRLFIMCTACLAVSAQASAGGFEQPNQSGSAAGVANAFVANANDASALVYNPAGIAWLTGVSVMAGVRLDYRDSSVITPAVHAPNKGSESATGSLYASWTPHDGRLAAGIGFSPLYVANNDWRTAFPMTGSLTKLTVDHATFDAVYAINSGLAVGLGGDWYITRATMTRGTQSFQGTDFKTFGGHAALMWKPLPAWSLGAMFRSGASVSMSGQANDSLSFKLPDSAQVGIAHDFADVWRFEADLKWSRWSALKQMNVITGAAITQPNALNLKDTLTAMAGVTWSWRERTQFRIGYAYDQGAGKNLNFNPIIADQDGHRISLGAGADMFGLHFDLAYQYLFYAKRTATGGFAGRYNDRRQSVVMSISNVFE